MAMLRFQTFINGLAAAADHDGLCAVMKDITDELAIDAFAYLGVSIGQSQPSDPILISTYPKEWTRFYLAHEFERIDPVIGTATADHIPFYWGITNGICPKDMAQEKLFQEASAYGIVHGWTVPVHDVTRRIATLNFCCSRDFDSFHQKIETNKILLHVISIHFHANVVKKTRGDLMKSRPSLSSREIECLEWSSKGKSRSDIGQILNISPRTVKFHIENAMRKLNVATTRQAVLRAALCGIING